MEKRCGSDVTPASNPPTVAGLAGKQLPQMQHVSEQEGGEKEEEKEHDSDLDMGSQSDECHAQSQLGPPLEFLPKDIEPQELQAYRADYRAFRAGHATGARGEIGHLVPSEKQLSEPWNDLKRPPYAAAPVQISHRVRMVPLIGLKLGASKASLSALSAANDHYVQRESLSISESSHSESSHQQVPSSAAPLPWMRGPHAAVRSQQGVGFLVHVLASLVCLLPSLLSTNPDWWECLGLPSVYASFVISRIWCTSPMFRVPEDTGFDQTATSTITTTMLSRILRMDRLIREGCVPTWFPQLCAIMYVLIAFQLTFGRRFRVPGNPHWISLWSAAPSRHDYSCWGVESEDAADCVLVRHSACTVLVSFYSCLAVMASCNRNVKGGSIVLRHKQSLLEAFPAETPSLFSYIERSVDSNDASWRKSRRYQAQSAAMSFVWTFLSFSIYAGLLLDSTSVLACVVFLSAAPCTFILQFTLLRYVLLRVLLYLEAVKARAAAMAYCDEEGVLPFTSSRAIFVWFSVRRNVQAQNEVAYQHTAPILGASLTASAACSFWVGSQLWRRGLSVYALTSCGGASLMVVASAIVSTSFVYVFMNTLLDISKLEEAHARQLRIAHLRLFDTCHSRQLWKQAMCRQQSGASQLPSNAMQNTLHDDIEANEGPAMNQDLTGALDMIEKVVHLLENHETTPTILGVEIGSKSFQVVYAAFLSNGWYLLVWGVLIPLMGSYKDDDAS